MCQALLFGIHQLQHQLNRGVAEAILVDLATQPMAEGIGYLNLPLKDLHKSSCGNSNSMVLVSSSAEDACAENSANEREISTVLIICSFKDAHAEDFTVSVTQLRGGGGMMDHATSKLAPRPIPWSLGGTGHSPAGVCGRRCQASKPYGEWHHPTRTENPQISGPCQVAWRRRALRGRRHAM